MHCPRGHAFDLARQGYVNLLTARAPAGAETLEMVAARSALLSSRYAPLVAAVADHAAAVASTTGLIVDAGAGTGQYLAALLDRLPGHVGLALDVAKPAVRVAARAHPRAAAAVGDVWQRLPLIDGAADLVLNVFAPRNGAEFHRVLRPGGVLIVVTPTPEHLGYLVRTLNLLSVDPAKQERLAATLAEHFELADRTRWELPLDLTRAEAELVVGMGPSAWHTDPAALSTRLSALPDPIPTLVSVDLHTFTASSRAGQHAR